MKITNSFSVIYLHSPAHFLLFIVLLPIWNKEGFIIIPKKSLRPVLLSNRTTKEISIKKNKKASQFNRWYSHDCLPSACGYRETLSKHLKCDSNCKKKTLCTLVSPATVINLDAYCCCFHWFFCFTCGWKLHFKLPWVFKLIMKPQECPPLTFN